MNPVYCEDSRRPMLCFQSKRSHNIHILKWNLNNFNYYGGPLFLMLKVRVASGYTVCEMQ